MASVMLVLYISDFSSSALAPLVSALDVEPEIAYRKIHLKYSNPARAIKAYKLQ